MWGCTVVQRTHLFNKRVFPTHVGVYRWLQSGYVVFSRFPHACGGVPFQSIKENKVRKFSPRMWGCTGSAGTRASSDSVFPTHVGVYLKIPPNRSTAKRFPHACGGVPLRLASLRSWMAFSPRMWGCTDVTKVKPAETIVFPTHVGVYRPARLVS